MKLKKILIITSSIDYTVDYMITKFSNVNFYRLNVDMLEFYKIRITEDNWEISNDVWKIGSNIIDSIYYRKPRLPDLSDYDFKYNHMIQKDIIAVVEGLVNSFDKYVLSRPYILHNCENKVFQLQKAKLIGFSIPKSIITNDTLYAKEFIDEDTIIKPITTGKIVFNDDVEIFQTNKIESIDEEISKTPVYMQNYIPKKYEVRATFIGSDVFCVKIESSNPIDWRDESAVNKYEIIEMPRCIYKKCIKLMELFSIDFGAFDFIVNDENNWIFLEVNPNGQWLWLENELKLNISEKIVEMLEAGTNVKMVN